MEIRRYKQEAKGEWDSFVRTSKNGTFLFCRDFMEYHGDRFEDCSYMFYEDDSLIALMLGNVKDGVYYSHQGLTYGGLVMDVQSTAVQVLTIFDLLLDALRQAGYRKIVYKAVPHIYHIIPAEEDLYALFRNKAVLSNRYVSSAILLSDKVSYSRTRKNGLKKAAKNSLQVTSSDNYGDFLQILGNNLKDRYDVAPVHSLEEITYLKERFPDEIHLYTVSDAKGEMLAGCIVFETPTVAHLQYTAGTEVGKSSGAIDILIDYILNEAYPHKRYFDYGNSNEDGGRYLNESLIYQKEGFGARGIVYDIYTIDL